jgi:phospholipid/cholesterol/gamma-HCH transport system substrate-binding protein
MDPRRRDLAVGSFVAAGLAVIAYLSISVGGIGLRRTDTLTVYAEFREIGGLTTRSPVVIGGVKVGTVESITLSDDFNAVVELSLAGDLKLSTDTVAQILTSGVLGNQYVGLSPGGDEEVLGPGDRITFTQDAVVLERLIGRLIQSFGVN